jgi:hypothetical protein
MPFGDYGMTGMSARVNEKVRRRILGLVMEESPEERGPFDPERITIKLCRELEALRLEGSTWVAVDTLVNLTRLSEEVVVAAAVYGHVCGWLTYSVHSVMLRETGRSVLRSLQSR